MAQRTSSGRYTAPKPKTERHSPMWLPALMGTCLLTGALVIVTNYMGILPGDAENRYLFLGLFLVVVGFGMASNYR